MSATALISGKLFREPEHKVSRDGKPFMSCTIKEGAGDAVTWWRALVFSASACEELATLHDGDGVAVSGDFKIELYERQGETRLSHTVFADRLISAKRRKREQAAERRAEQGRERQASGQADDEGEIPF